MALPHVNPLPNKTFSTNTFVPKRETSATNHFVVQGYKPTMWQFIRSSTCTFSHMTYLMSHVTCLNNTCGWFYEFPHSGLQQDNYKPNSIQLKLSKDRSLELLTATR